MENRIWLKGDTHLHTCNSDGKLTPGQLVPRRTSNSVSFHVWTVHGECPTNRRQ